MTGRERVERPDGTVAVQTKPPRADMLAYRAGDRWLYSVLVRRTHDVELARALAEQRWRDFWIEVAVRRAEQAGLRCGGAITVPDLNTHRVGWWTTTAGAKLRPGDARDQQNRVVRWRPDPAAVHGAGPGVEFGHNPSRPPAEKAATTPAEPAGAGGGAQ